MRWNARYAPPSPRLRKVHEHQQGQRPKQNYGAETWRAPTIKDGETVLLDEPGRVYQSTNYAVTYQSYYLRVVGLEFGGMEMRVRLPGAQRTSGDFDLVEMNTKPPAPCPVQKNRWKR